MMQDKSDKVNHNPSSSKRMEKYNILVLSLIISLSIICLSISAQNQNNNWYFGNQAAVTFVNGNLSPLTSSQMLSTEGCASVSEPTTGNLLFYTNGLQIWNKNNTVMPNGNNLLSGPSTSSSQGVIIVPYPDSVNLYYVFTVDETNNNAINGFRYSVVDMSLDNGLGDVVQQQKNILIQQNTTERIAVAKNDNGTGYWVVIHERNNNCFKAFEINSSGLNLTPVVSNIGATHSTAQQTNGDDTMGYMKFSPDGKKLAVAIFASSSIELYDFDTCTGTLSNVKSFSTLDNPYGVEFSPNSSILYYSLYYNAGFQGAVYQLNLATANPSPQLIGISSSINNQCMGALQLAPNNKIYISINSEPWLSSIEQPNNSGITCGFVDQAVFLPSIGLSPTTGLFGLPQMVPEQITVSSLETELTASNFCFEDSTEFEISGTNSISSILWDFGVLNTSNDTSSAINPIFVYPDSGLYSISAIVNIGCRSDTLLKQIEILNCDSLVPVGCDLIIPNTFTPNGDGSNDQFSVISNCNVSFFDLSIYSRWGELVWSTNNQNDKWDGRNKENNCASDVYFYLLRVETSSGSALYKGDVTLLR